MEIKNKKAYFNYFVDMEIESGIALTGTEIKSVRKGSVDIKDTYELTDHTILDTTHFILKTDNEQYDLYKNPTITIKLPNDVVKVSNIKAVPLYLDNFSINTSYSQDTREINIKLNGEQERYNLNNTN